MKVEIDSYGNLSFAPESPVENYALSKWWDDWQAHKVTLTVRFDRDGSEQLKRVEDSPP